MESVIVLTRGLRSLANSISCTRHLNFVRELRRIQVDFHSDNISSHGPPKVVRQSLRSCV